MANQHKGVGLALEGLHVGQVHLQLVYGLQRHEAVVASLRPVCFTRRPSGNAFTFSLEMLESRT